MSLDITPLVPAGRQVIEAYGGGGFVIAGTRYVGSVIVLPERTLAWMAAAAGDVTEFALAPLFEAPPPGANAPKPHDPAATSAPGFLFGRPAPLAEILVVGCGPRFAPPPETLRRAIKTRGFALEWMDTGAACRTFNVLLAEGRLVVAALIAVP
jgi:uncharacterized protein